MHSICSHFQIVECNQCCKLEGVGTLFALTEIERKNKPCRWMKTYVLRSDDIICKRPRYRLWGPERTENLFFFEWFKQHFYLWWILDTCHARVFLVFRTFSQILQVWVTPVICFASTWFLMVVLSPSLPHTLHTHNFPQYCPFLSTSCCVDVIIVSISSFNCFRRPPSLRARA